MNAAQEQAIRTISYPFEAAHYRNAAWTVRNYDARMGAELQLLATLSGVTCEASHIGTYQELRDHGYRRFGPSC